MTCPFLRKEEYVTCSACGALYMPGAAELIKYCGRDTYAFCSFYRMSVIDGDAAAARSDSDLPVQDTAEPYRQIIDGPR